ncbi:MAG TPA: hypothetical protein VGA22_07695 [Gemmatimonadales bacterium]|jgi:hypothetical protein
MVREEGTHPATVVADRDPVTGAYERDVDRSLLRKDLKKTPTERMRALIWASLRHWS